ncbi:MAG: TRAP transporter small permease [Desulfobacterales bacterium]|nr:TRAP transporter small permease [Desulfobacterales bacterium]
MGGFIRWVITNLGRLGSLMFLGVAVMITLEVIMRFVFRSPTTWVMEISSLFTIVASFLLFAYTLQEKGHTRVDFITAMVSRRSVFFLELFTTLLGSRLLRRPDLVRRSRWCRVPRHGGGDADPSDPPVDPAGLRAHRRRADVHPAPRIPETRSSSGTSERRRTSMFHPGRHARGPGHHGRLCRHCSC